MNHSPQKTSETTVGLRPDACYLNALSSDLTQGILLLQ